MANFTNDPELKLAAAFTIGTEGGNAINVGVQILDRHNGGELACRASIFGYMSDDAYGDSIVATAPDGGVAIGTDGVLVPVTPALTNRLLVKGTLAISATAEKFKTTTLAAYLVNGIFHTKAITDNLTFTAAHVVSATKFGVVLIQINAAGTVSTKVPIATQVYNDAPTALAALPSVDAGNVALGYIAIAAGAGAWTANTSDMTNGSDLTTAAFTDATEVTLTGPKEFHLVSESDGDIDINVTESGVKTLYLVLVMPDGAMYVSSAITFA